MRLSTPFASRSPALLLVLIVGVIGCKRASDKPKEVPGELFFTEGGLELKTDAAVVTVGADAKVPADFPKTIAIYPGARVDLATSSLRGAKPAWTLTLETGDERAKVVEYYAGHMTAFTKATDLAMGDTQMTVWQGPQNDVTMMVAPGASGETTISVTVTSK